MRITKTLLLACAALICASWLAAPANAASTKGKQPTNQELLERIEQLEQEVKESKEHQEKTDARLSPIEDSHKEASWSFTNGRPRIRSADGRFELAIRSRVHFDAGTYFQDDDLPASVVTGRDLASGAFVRRARVAVEGRVFKDFWYEFSMDFGSSGTESSAVLQRARVAYHGIPNIRINVGILKPMMTAVDTTSSNEITFIERAAIINTVIDAFGGADRRRAVEVQFQKSNALWEGDNIVISGAYTGQQTGGAHGTDEGSNFVGRAAWRLWSDGVSNIQVGGSGAKLLSLTGVAAPGGPHTITLEDRPELRVDATRLVSTGAIPIEGGHVYGFEGGANIKNFYVQGEYYKINLDRDLDCTGCVATAENPEFSGWYVEGSWIITGEPKGYAASSTSNSVGVFGAPTVIRPFSVSQGGIGAIEIAGRYSEIDLDFLEGAAGTPIATAAGAIRGGQQQIWAIGVNWYMNANIRLMFNYLNVSVDRLNAAGLQAGQDYDAIGGRMQFAF
jgi:phosphate-selective porin OprO/OprP